MGTVTPIFKNKTRRITQISLGALERELRNDLRKPEVLNAQQPDATELLIDEVEAVATEHHVKLLELAHRREQFTREEVDALAQINAELEHAAYFAFMAGAPEDELYALDTRTADALSSAIRKVQAQA
jgi:hypothetical protein